MMQALVGIVILIFLWLGVLAGLLGLIDVARSQYENKTTRWLGLAIGIPTIIPIFALAIVLTPLFLEKIATAAFERPNAEVTSAPHHETNKER